MCVLFWIAVGVIIAGMGLVLTGRSKLEIIGGIFLILGVILFAIVVGICKGEIPI